MRQSTNSSQEQNEKAMSANSMFLIALLSYTLINQLGINKSVCVHLIHNSTGQPPYWRIYEDVNYSGKDTAIGHGACIDDFTKSGSNGTYKNNGTV
ncbi:unnamed protein product [Schistosoma curassoni]|nr:unnamed protein product [Schistosoma curassoni]CAH8431868.1 unnamed protein product [Schistosoma curassoni]